MDKNISRQEVQYAGGYIRSIRGSKNRTLKEVAAELDISQMYLSEIERGLKIPSDIIVQNLEDYFGIENGILFTLYKRAPLRAVEEVEEDDTLREVLLAVRKNPKFTKDDKKRLYEGLRELYRDIDK